VTLLVPELDPTPADLGGRACLSLANTEVWRLVSGVDVLAIVERAATYARRSVHASDRDVAAIADDEATHEAMARLRDLRDPVYDVFLGLHEGSRPTRAALAGIERHAAEALGLVRVLDAGDGFALAYQRQALHPLDRIRLLSARSALEVLASDVDVPHLKRCAGDGCGFLFVDDSRNQSRRWCDTKVCGNRARVKAHYRRRKAGLSGGSR
jgi:predicted RNA-binding Zn ribbon-like protein